MAWEPRSCCLCISIRVGTLILGWISLIGCFLSLLSSLKFVTASYDDFTHHCTQISQERHVTMDPDICARIMISTIICDGALSGMGTLVSILLIAGVNKNKPEWIIPYLGSQVISLGLMTLILVSLIGVSIYVGSALMSFTFILVFVPSMLISSYLISVVYACYKEIVRQNCIGAECSGVPYVEQEDLIPRLQMQ
ncbi:lysosomal-associated transmembrane protein 4B-like [Palaemon carinicauda]|uniref:lysosomal-associated transmembrane protein 4B-like n=1 Tax=Palaemon carinicauda TaxID=392227 RepID=UPI0035B5ECDB